MFTARCSLVTMFVAVTVLIHSMTGGLRGAYGGHPACNCFFGAVESTTPRCLCACGTGYLPPRCQYRPNDGVRVEVWYDRDVVFLLPESALTTIRDNLGTDARETNLVYARASEVGNRQTALLLEMTGAGAYLLRYAIETNQPWITSEGIVSAHELLVTVQPNTSFGSELGSLILGEIEGYTVTLEAVFLLFVVTFIVLVMVLIELFCLAVLPFGKHGRSDSDDDGGFGHQ